MKKCFAFAIAFLLLAVLCACVHAPTMDLSGFLQQSKQLGMPLDPMQIFQTSAADGECAYYIQLDDNLSLRLLCLTTGEIYECRVLLQKMQSDGSPVSVNTQMSRGFLSECSAVLCAYASINPEEAQNCLHALSATQETIHEQFGSNTTQLGHFSVQLLVHPLETVLSVRNVQLMEAPTTVLPESSPLYGDTTVTRKETVPHR